MTKVLDDITADLARVTLTVGTSNATYARLVDAVSDETVTIDELTAAERTAWATHQALCGLSLKHESLLHHVRTMLLTARVPGWVNHGGHVIYDVDSLALVPAADD